MAKSKKRRKSVSLPPLLRPERTSIWDHPKLAAVLAFISLAAGFSRKESALATWLCLSLAFLFGTVWIWKSAFVRRNDRRKLLGSIFSVVMAGFLVGIGLYLTETRKPRPEPPPVVLRVKDWERLRPLPGQKLAIRLHLSTTSLTPLKIDVKGGSQWWGGRPEDMDFDERKRLEGLMWRDVEAATSSQPTHLFTMPPRSDDFWIPLETTYALTLQQVNALGVSAVYFIGRIRDVKGATLLEFCAHTGPDSRTVSFCVDHNGTPLDEPLVSTMREPSAVEPTKNLSGRYIEGRRITYADIPATGLQNQTFERCEFVGPATLAPTGRVAITYCHFFMYGGDAFIEVPEGKIMPWAIPVVDCSFRYCIFREVSLVGTRDQIGRWKQGMRNDR